MIKFEMLDPRMTDEHLGFLPSFLSEDDPAPAREQIDKNYAHGGGWRPMKEWTMATNDTIKYPGDPRLRPLARAKLRDETILFYDCAILAIVQPDGSFEIARVD